MKSLIDIFEKQERLVAGIMSGTSVDGVDVAIVKLKGSFTDTKAELVAFENIPFHPAIRTEIFKLFDEQISNNKLICSMNFVLGEVFADAVIKTCAKNKIPLSDLDLIGSHGQTVYHLPTKENFHGYALNSTLQIGEAAVIAEKTQTITVSDFRVADMAAGGNGAPLVPYTEFCLYREESTIGLLNVGGIANITILPPDLIDNIVAFDTGPGNMVIDCVMSTLTQGQQSYDKGGELALMGRVDEGMLKHLLEDAYFRQAPPKTCGREQFGVEYTKAFLQTTESLSFEDKVATATALTARSVAEALKDFPLTKLIVGGGGSYNQALIRMLKSYSGLHVHTWEELGGNSDAKEAVAFAVLANETINGNPSNAPGATGARKGKILGKISVF